MTSRRIVHIARQTGRCGQHDPSRITRNQAEIESERNAEFRLTGRPGARPRPRPPSAMKCVPSRAQKKTLEGAGSIRLHFERPTSSPGELDEAVYFLCRCRLRSLRCLCFRIFLRRFLITLPTGSLRAPRDSRRSMNGMNLQGLVSSAAQAAPSSLRATGRGPRRGEV